MKKAFKSLVIFAFCLAIILSTVSISFAAPGEFTLKATVTPTSVTLKWTESSGADKYAVYRKQGTKWTSIKELSADTKSYTIKKLKKGKIIQVLQRLVGSKTGKHRVKTLSGKAKKAYKAIPESDRLTKYDIEQGTVTVSNIGSVTRGIPGRVALLSIIPPQVFVACIGAVNKKPVVKQDENGNDIIVVGNEMPIDLVFDHRACDFGDLVPFINKLEDIFKNPEQMYNW